VLILINKKI